MIISLEEENLGLEMISKPQILFKGPLTQAYKFKLNTLIYASSVSLVKSLCPERIRKYVSILSLLDEPPIDARSRILRRRIQSILFLTPCAVNGCCRHVHQMTFIATPHSNPYHSFINLLNIGLGLLKLIACC